MEEIKPKPYLKYYILVWIGLFKDECATHYKKMGKAIWLFLSLLHTANGLGEIKRLQFKTISQRTGISISTLKKFMATLRNNGYIRTRSSGRFLEIQIMNWKSYEEKRIERDEKLEKYEEYLNSIDRSTETAISGKPRKKLLGNKGKLVSIREKVPF